MISQIIRGIYKIHRTKPQEHVLGVVRVSGVQCFGNRRVRPYKIKPRDYIAVCFLITSLDKLECHVHTSRTP